MTAVVNKFAPDAKIIHLDIDPAEIGKNVRVDVPIVGDVKMVLQAINHDLAQNQRLQWQARLAVLKSRKCQLLSRRITHS